VPSFGDIGQPRAESYAPIPSYSPLEPAGLGFPTADAPGEQAAPDAAEQAPEEEASSPGQWSDGTAPPPAGRLRRGGRSGRRAAAAAASAATAEGAPDLAADPLGLSAGDSPAGTDGASGETPDDTSRKTATGTGTRRLPVLLLIAVLLLGGAYLVKTQLLDSSSTSTSTAPTVHSGGLPPAQLAASLRDPHFKHGYDAGKKRAPNGIQPANREAICRGMALAERANGYPWGAHDRAGCLVALAG
jgi:hypothetical protein